MKFSTVTVLTVLSALLSGVIADDAARLTALLSQAAQDQLAALQAEEIELNSRDIEATCNVRNIAIRQEFGDLPPWMRKSYTDAVLCLQNKTTQTPLSLVPGARSRVSFFNPN